MKKVVFISALALGFLSVQAGAQGCMATLKQKGLTVGTSPDYPPYESLDEKNQIVGFDIDLINAIGKKIGLKVNVVGQSFDGLIPALISKKIDLIAAGMTITDERKKSVNFSLPYVSTQNVIVVRKENIALSKTAQLNGKSVAVQIGSAQEGLAKKIQGANVKSYNLYTDAALAVQTRQADSMIVASVVAKNFTQSYPDLRVTGTVNKIQSGLAIRKDCNDLTNRVNAALIEMRNSGELAKLAAKWKIN